MCNKTREWSELTITGCSVREMVDSGLNLSYKCLPEQSSCVAKQKLPVIWFITNDVYPPAFTYIFGADATNPKGINEGGVWLQYLFCSWEQIYFQREGGRLGFILWDAHYHSVWHTFTLAPTVVAKQRAHLRTLKLRAGKIGPRGGGGRDWCQTSRATRSTWGFTDISSVLFGKERVRDQDTWRDGNETKMERRRVGCGKISNVIHSGIKFKCQRSMADLKIKDWRITTKNNITHIATNDSWYYLQLSEPFMLK